MTYMYINLIHNTILILKIFYIHIPAKTDAIKD